MVSPPQQEPPALFIGVEISDGEDGSEVALSIAIDGVNDAPEFIGSNDEIEVAENTTSVADCDAFDLDGDEFSFAIVDGADEGRFEIDSVTGELRLADHLDG